MKGRLYTLKFFTPSKACFRNSGAQFLIVFPKLEIYFLGYLNAAKMATESLERCEYRSVKRNLPHLVIKRSVNVEGRDYTLICVCTLPSTWWSQFLNPRV